MDALAHLGPWTWFVLGGVLLLAEMLAPGAFLLWLGLAALATGGAAYASDLSWQGEVVTFAILSVAAVLVGRKVSPGPGEASDRPFLNRRADSYVGRVFVLEAPIAGGVGRVRIDDTVWRVEGEDLPAGARVIVTRADGPTLHVAPKE